MPGNIIFKPIEAHFKDEKVDPYLRFTLGNNKAKTQVSANKDSNAHLHWNESLTLNRSHEEFCDIHVKNKADPSQKEIGIVRVPLAEIEKCGKSCKWYDIGLHGKPAGQLLLEVDCDNQSMTNEPTYNQSGQSKMTKDEPMKYGGSGFAQDKQGISGQSKMTKDEQMKCDPSGFAQDKQGISGQSSGQSKITKDEPMKYGQSGFVQDKEGISGQSKLSKDEQMKCDPSGFAQDKQGISGQSKITKDEPMKYGQSGFVQDKEGVSNLNKPSGNMQQDFGANVTEKKRFGA